MAEKKYEFDAVLNKHPKINAAFIEFPYDVKKEFGKGRVKVKAWLDGYMYQGSLVKMGGKCHWLGITQEVRKAIGKDPDDLVHVILTEEIEERTVEVPDDLLKLLKKEPPILDYFNKLSFTHRKEYVRWITEAKKEETRNSRVSKTMDMLRANRKTPH